MSCANQHGQTTKITGDWADLVFVPLKDYKVAEIGYIGRKGFNQPIKTGLISAIPLTRRTMLETGHLFAEHGEIIGGKNVEGYL